MTIKYRLDGSQKGQALQAFDRVVERMFEKRLDRVMGIVEFKRNKNDDWAEDTGKEPQVVIGIAGVELALGAQEHILRSAQRALYASRTSDMTLDQDDTLRFEQQTLDKLPGNLDALESARLHGALVWASKTVHKLAGSAGLDGAAMRHELKKFDALLAKALTEQLPFNEAKAMAALLEAEDAKVAVTTAAEDDATDDDADGDDDR
jgi:hypothetical protein